MTMKRWLVIGMAWLWLSSVYGRVGLPASSPYMSKSNSKAWTGARVHLGTLMVGLRR